VSDAIQKRIVLEELRTAGLAGPDQELPASVRVKHGVSSDGHRLHYYLNYSSQPASIAYAYADGGELLGGAKLARGQKAGIGAWDVLIVREDGAVKP
jgi:beta-galactosidase